MRKKSSIFLFCLIFFANAVVQAQSGGITLNKATIIASAGSYIINPGDIKFNTTTDSLLNNGSIIVSGDVINNGNSFSDLGFGTEIFTANSVIRGANNSIFNNIIIKPGAVISLNKNIDIKNDWTNNGKFVHNNNSVSFSGNSQQNMAGSGTFYDLLIQNTVNFGASIDTIDHRFSNSQGTMNGGTSRIVFKNGSSLIQSNSKNFYDLEILNGAIVNHTTGSGNIHVAHSFVNNGVFTEDTAYVFYFDKSNAVETMPGTGTTYFGNLVIGDGANLSKATTLNCSADFIIIGGSMAFRKGSIFNSSNNTVTFSNLSSSISGSGTANFYNLTTNVTLDPGDSMSFINNNFTINTGGVVAAHKPVYKSSATLIYNTNNAALYTGFEWNGNSNFPGIGQPYNVTIQNTNNIVLAAARTVPGMLTISAASSFNLNNYTLTANGGFAGTGFLKGSATSELIAGGAGTVYFDATTNVLKTLTVKPAGNIALGNALNITPGNSASGYGTITANGILASNGFLTLKSDSAGTARVGMSSGYINGDVTVERFIPARRAWRFLTVPFQKGTGTTINASWQESQTSSTLNCPTNDPASPGYGTFLTYNGSNGYDLNITGNPSIQVWENNDWQPVPSTLTKKLSDYPAYYIFIRGDRHVCLSQGTNAISNNTVLRAKGELNQKGATTLPLTFTGQPGDFFLIGNPYASAVDITSVITASRSSGINFDKFWVWDPEMAGTYGVGGYVAFSNGVQVPVANSTYKAGTVIQSGQAFMLQLDSSSATAIINFKESDKNVNETNVFGLRSVAKQNTFSSVYVNLLAPADSNQDVLVDGVGAIFNNKFSAGIDKDDAAKMWNINEGIALKRDDKPLAIEFRPFKRGNDTLFLQLNLKQRAYKLQLFSSGLNLNDSNRIWLVDKYLNRQIELSADETILYSFTPGVDTSSYRNRFMLVLGNSKKDVEGVAKSSAKSSRINEGKITLFPNPLTGNKMMLRFKDMPGGTYVVSLFGPKGEKLQQYKIEHKGSEKNYSLRINHVLPESVYIVNIIGENTGTITNLRLLATK